MLKKTIAGAAVQIAEGVGNIVGIRAGTEEPAFTVERTIGGVEIRRYGPPRIAAETTIDATRKRPATRDSEYWPATSSAPTPAARRSR